MMNTLLTHNQRLKASMYYENHKSHVNSLVERAKTEYAPTLTEDKEEPMLWKPAHWKWFFNYYYSDKQLT